MTGHLPCCLLVSRDTHARLPAPGGRLTSPAASLLGPVRRFTGWLIRLPRPDPHLRCPAGALPCRAMRLLRAIELSDRESVRSECASVLSDSANGLREYATGQPERANTQPDWCGQHQEGMAASGHRRRNTPLDALGIGVESPLNIQKKAVERLSFRRSAATINQHNHESQGDEDQGVVDSQRALHSSHPRGGRDGDIR